MGEIIVNFVQGLVRALISVPVEFFRQIIANNWQAAFRTLITTEGIIFFVIIFVIVIWFRIRAHS